MNFEQKNNIILSYINQNKDYINNYNGRCIESILIQYREIYENVLYFDIENIKLDGYFLRILQDSNLIYLGSDLILEIKLILYARFLIQIYSDNTKCFKTLHKNNLRSYFNELKTRLWVHSDEFIDYVYLNKI